jgi:hypothetical protein
MPRSSNPAAMARSDSQPAACSSLIVALLRARSCRVALPAAWARCGASVDQCSHQANRHSRLSPTTKGIYLWSILDRLRRPGCLNRSIDRGTAHESSITLSPCLPTWPERIPSDAASPYSSGCSRDWIKSKTRTRPQCSENRKTVLHCAYSPAEEPIRRIAAASRAVFSCC